MADDNLDRLLEALDKAQAKRETSKATWGDVARTAAQGLTFGAADEIEAGLRSMAGGNYDQALKEARDSVKRYQAESPYKSAAVEFAGGALPAAGSYIASLLTGGAAAPAAAASTARMAPLAARVASGALKNAGVGAGVGAVSGFAGAEGGDGTTSEQFINRLGGATTGALYGAGIGGALGAAAPLAKAGLDRLRATPQTQGQDAVLAALARDNLTPEQAAQAYAQRQATLGAKPELLADLYPGSNIAGLTDMAVQSPATDKGSLVQQLAQRGKDQGARILDDFRTLYGSRGNFYATEKALNEARQAASKPLYEAAYARGEVANPAIWEQLRRLPSDVLQDAGRAAQWDGVDPAKLTQLVKTADGGKATALTRIPTVQDLDYVKRGLDRIIERETNDFGRVSSEGRRALQAKDSLLAILDKEVPEFAAAREAWAGPSAMMDAMRYGQRAARERSEITIERLATMGKSEKEAFLVGFMDAIENRLGSVKKGNDASAIALTPNAEKALKAAALAVTDSPASAEAFVSRLVQNVEREAQMARSTREMVNNSRTALRQATRENVNQGGSVLGGVASELAGVATTGVPGVGTLAQRGGQSLMSAFGNQLTGAGNVGREGEIGRLLFGSNISDVQRSMLDLAQRRAAQQRMQAPVGMTPGLLGGVGGGVVQR